MKKYIYTLIFQSITTITFGQTTLLYEDFQAGIPITWTIIDNDSLTPVDPKFTEAWILAQDPEDNQNNTAESTSYFSPEGTASRWLITPTLLLGEFGNVVSWKAKSKDASFLDGYQVLISTTGSEISDFKDTLLTISGENFEWTTREIDLSSKGYLSQNVNIAFVNNTTNGFKLFLDSVLVQKETAVSLGEFTSDKFTIFPNPANEIISIQSTQPISGIIIRNNLGQVVINDKDTVLNISKLTPGIYSIEIRVDSKVTIQKFSKL